VTRTSTKELCSEIEFELQETDHHRELDSLETVVVRSFLCARGFAVSDDHAPPANTIEGWLTWVEHSLAAG
jgi:hypothetical protein